MAGSTKPLPVPAAASGDPAADEENQVHEVYEAIAPHFARTRFKVSHPHTSSFVCLGACWSGATQMPATGLGSSSPTQAADNSPGP